MFAVFFSSDIFFHKSDILIFMRTKDVGFLIFYVGIRKDFFFGN